MYVLVSADSQPYGLGPSLSGRGMSGLFACPPQPRAGHAAAVIRPCWPRHTHVFAPSAGRTTVL